MRLLSDAASSLVQEHLTGDCQVGRNLPAPWALPCSL